MDPSERASMLQIKSHPWLKMKNTTVKGEEVEVKVVEEVSSTTPDVPEVENIGGLSLTARERVGHKLSSINEDLTPPPLALPPMEFNKSDRSSDRISGGISMKCSPSSSTKSKSPVVSPNRRRKSLSPLRKVGSALDVLTDELDRKLSSGCLTPVTPPVYDSPMPGSKKSMNFESSLPLDSTCLNNSSDFTKGYSGENSPVDGDSTVLYDVKGWGATRSRNSSSAGARSPSHEGKGSLPRTPSRINSTDTLSQSGSVERVEDSDRPSFRLRQSAEEREKAKAKYISSASSRQSSSTTVSSSSTASRTGSMRFIQSPQTYLSDELDKRLNDLEKYKDTEKRLSGSGSESPHVSYRKKG